LENVYPCGFAQLFTSSNVSALVASVFVRESTYSSKKNVVDDSGLAGGAGVAGDSIFAVAFSGA
jgi:hypothetical protein